MKYNIPTFGAGHTSQGRREKHKSCSICSGDDSISGFQFRYDIDTIFLKYRDIGIDILKMISMYILYKHKNKM